MIFSEQTTSLCVWIMIAGSVLCWCCINRSLKFRGATTVHKATSWRVGEIAIPLFLDIGIYRRSSCESMLITQEAAAILHCFGHVCAAWCLWHISARISRASEQSMTGRSLHACFVMHQTTNGESLGDRSQAFHQTANTRVPLCVCQPMGSNARVDKHCVYIYSWSHNGTSLKLDTTYRYIMVIM